MKSIPLISLDRQLKDEQHFYPLHFFSYKCLILGSPLNKRARIISYQFENINKKKCHI